MQRREGLAAGGGLDSCKKMPLQMRVGKGWAMMRFRLGLGGWDLGCHHN